MHDFSRDLLVRFANSLFSVDDGHKWIGSLRQALAILLPSVDRISLNFARGSSLLRSAIRGDVVATMRVYGERGTPPTFLVDDDSARDASHFVKRFRDAGLPVNEYHLPTCTSFYLVNGTYLGSIILWNHKSSAPISAATVGELESIRPFLTFVFSSLVARFSASNVVYSTAIRALNQIAKGCGLSRRERAVYLCRFNGKTVSETAELLHISEATVRRHIRSANSRINGFRQLRIRTIGLPLQSRDSNET